ncbi:MAG: hypothetical protein U0229_22595 [Anaeromyxobacter sp.]
MGVEYQHTLAVDDLAWRPSADTASRVEKALRTWGLIGSLEKVVDLTTGNALSPALPADPGRGVGLAFTGVEGPAVAKLAGASAYGAAPEERYLMRTIVALGSDLRVPTGREELYHAVKAAPRAGDREVAVVKTALPHPFASLFGVAFPSEGMTQPPVVAIQVSDHCRLAWKHWSGLWRAAVVLDFGKDLPAFAEGRRVLPEASFTKALSEAFRGPLIEWGEYY